MSDPQKSFNLPGYTVETANENNNALGNSFSMNPEGEPAVMPGITQMAPIPVAPPLQVPRYPEPVFSAPATQQNPPPYVPFDIIPPSQPVAIPTAYTMQAPAVVLAATPVWGHATGSGQPTIAGMPPTAPLQGREHIDVQFDVRDEEVISHDPSLSRDGE
jgi:hypothetical protein